MLEEKKVEITAGERVLIVGESGTGKTLLFRTLAGLWPWGAGRVAAPGAKNCCTCRAPPTFLRARCARSSPIRQGGAFRGGRLRQCTDAAQARPAGAHAWTATQRWDRELSDDEQQTLAFARVVLHAPPWVLIDEVLDSLDEDARHACWIFSRRNLQHTGIIHIGRAAHDHSVSRVLHLVKDPTLRRLNAPVAQPAV